MIDEKRLANVIIGDTWHDREHSWTLGDFTEEEAGEVLRLARLGLWAKKHGVRGLSVVEMLMSGSAKVAPWSDDAALAVVRESLAALPKER